MANTLGYYNPVFYANEALIWLHKALGMAGRVHMGYDEEHRVFNRGDTINIRRPSSFTVQDAPSTAQDITPDSIQMTLNKWKEVKFKLTDKELSFTGDRIIQEHIMPAAYQLANQIDQDLAALYKDVPWTKALVGSTYAVADITGAYQTLFDNEVPMTPGALHAMISGQAQNELTQLSAFAQWQGSANTGVQTQLSGTLGQRYGFEFFANQNVPTHVSGAIADAVGTLDAATVAKGLTSITVNAVTNSSAWKAGDTFVIAGHTQRYAITANVSASGGGVVVLAITPPLATLYVSGDVVTADVPSSAATTKQSLFFHKEAFALAFGRLPDLRQFSGQLGAQVESLQDPVTGLSVRARVYYVGNSSEVHVALDVLYGVKTLDGNLALRVRQ